MNLEDVIKEQLKKIQPVSPDDTTENHPDFVYHATSLNRVYDIIDFGFIQPHKPWHGTDQEAWPDGSTKSRIYFSENASVVWCFSPEEGGCSVILRVEKRSFKFKKESGTGDIYYEGKIPIKNVEILVEDGNKKWIELRVFGELVES